MCVCTYSCYECECLCVKKNMGVYLRAFVMARNRVRLFEMQRKRKRERESKRVSDRYSHNIPQRMSW